MNTQKENSRFISRNGIHQRMVLAAYAPRLRSRSPHSATTLGAFFFSATCYSSTLIDHNSKGELEIAPKFSLVSQKACTE
jgi:hypothetical protein